MSNRPRAHGRAVGAAQALALVLSFVLVSGVGGVLAAGLMLPAVAVANGTTDLSIEAFEDLPTELDATTLPEKSVILAADGTELATFFSQNRVVVPLTEIAPIMQKAVIAIEDKRFYEHGGIDPQGMLRAAAKGLLHVGKEGASTLTQQYVKNVLIQQALEIDDPVEQAAALEAAKENDGTEGYARKLREAKLAIALEQRMTKDQILEGYLNIAQFGRSSIYGVESAANFYFNVSAKDLNYLQAATIAGITQSPTKWDPQLNPANAQNRRNVVLGVMRDQGYITQDEYNSGIATPLADTLAITPIRQGCMAAGDRIAGAGYFCDYVTKILLNDVTFGETKDDREKLLYRGGLTITTTLLPAEQAAADASVKAGVPVGDASGVGSAIVSVEPGTGKITSMAQTTIYTALSNAGATETSVNWNTSNAYGGASGFPAGSTFKPFTLVEWIKQGHALTQTFDGKKVKLDEHDFTACGASYNPGHKTWTPANSEGQGGIMNALDATKNSVNSAYLAMAKQLDLCNIMQDAADLGVTNPSRDNLGANVEAKPSNVIGSGSVAPLNMAAAFAAFAANGVYCTPIAITSVVDSTGASLPVPSANCQQKLDPDVAAGVTYALSNVWKGTAKGLGPGYTAAGKTGTTSENEHTWFVGYTPLKATAVWVGHPKGFFTMHGQTINGKTYRSGPYGSSIAAPTWKRFMDQAMAGLAVPGFTQPSSRIINGEKVSVPSVVGQTVEAATATLKAAGFGVQVSPTAIDSDYPAGTVAAQNPSGSATRYSIITLTPSTGVPVYVAPVEPDPGQGGQGGWGTGGNGNGGGGGGGVGGGGKPGG